MKICHRCSISYSDMWNYCMVCNSALESAGIVSKIFPQKRQSAKYLFPIIERSIENADALFLYLDLKLRPIMCNEAIEHMTGYTRKDFFKGNWLDLLFGKNKSRRDIFKAVLSSCFSSEKSRAYEGSVTKRDGSECVLSWRNTAISDASGKIWGLFCVAQDITDHKLTENDIAACSERLRNIFTSIKDYSFITTNLDDKITYYGAGTESLFNWKNDMTLENIALVFKTDDAAGIINKIKSDINKRGSSEQELTLLKLDGSEFPATLTVNALKGSKSKNAGYIYVIKDITDRKKIEDKMIENEKMAAIGQLAAGVAHEINNPLLVLRGRLDMLEMDGEKLSANARKTFDLVRNQADRMKSIVDRLLYYSRKKPINMDIVDINGVLKTISPLIAYFPDFNKIVWKEELDDSVLKIKGDFNQLQEVFLNLSTNACQAMPEGGTLTMRSFNLNKDTVRVTVEDTGPGIKTENLSKLFMPFFTTKDSGTGLGLSLCRSIVETHGGIISVESVIGKGTKFHVDLPTGSPLGEAKGRQAGRQ
jgi:PAS domain S-box-containing protein